MTPGPTVTHEDGADVSPLRDSLAILAHELRNPLMLIRTEVAILRRANTDRESVNEGCAIIDRQLTQVAALIDDLLLVARAETTDADESRHRLDVRDLLTAMVDATSGLVEARDLRLALDSGPDPLIIDASPVRLTQALTNILTNAAKYTDSGGAIIVLGTRIGDWIEIRIRDTGRGIPAQLLTTVFDPYVRAPSLGVEGSGIGLTVARHLIEAHGGKLEARSEGLGLGSEFVIRLPAATKSPTRDPRRPV